MLEDKEEQLNFSKSKKMKLIHEDLVENQLHLAIFRQPFLNLILNGEKIVESRFSKNKILPFKQVNEGDRIFMKESGGGILGEFTVKKVIYFENITSKILEQIKEYSQEIAAHVDPNFWQKRSHAHYATLIFVHNVIKYSKAYPFPKRDQRAWLKLLFPPENLLYELKK